MPAGGRNGHLSPREDGRPGLVQIQTCELQPAIPPPDGHD